MTALLLGLAVLLLLPPRDRRLRTVLRPPAARPAQEPRPASARSPVAACVLGGLAVAVLVGGLAGIVAGTGLVLLGPPLLARLEPREERERAEQLAAALPLALDLLAACLAGGAPLRTAVEAVARAAPGECGERFTRVAGALAVGTPPEAAWSHLAGAGRPAGAALPEVPAGAAARALARACAGGAPPAALVARLAEDARAHARAEAEQRARRAGVLAVLPLGVCFLPAFVLLGVVPVVVGLAAPLLAGL